MEEIKFFRKRSGRIVKFNPEKIGSAISRALKEAEGVTGRVFQSDLPSKLADEVVAELNDESSAFFVKPDSIGSRVPKLENVQDCVEEIIGRGHDVLGYDPVFADTLRGLYATYRARRDEARKKLKVSKRVSDKRMDVTDKGMLLLGDGRKELEGWNRAHLEEDLAQIVPDGQVVSEIAKAVESSILKSGLEVVSSDLVTEFANNELTARGIQSRLHTGNGYLVERDFVEALLGMKSKENSNILSNNPEAVNLAIAGYVLKNWAFDAVFSKDVVEAHQCGEMYVHDLDHVTRVYCSSHSVEYLKKYGLKGLVNLNTTSNPAKTASVLTGHLNTFLASMQAYYAGALGLGYINVFYAPFLVGMNARSMYQIAQELIFNGSQNAFSRGGQSLHPDELIWIKRDGKYQSVRIGELVDGLLKEHEDEIRYSDEYEVYKTDNEGIETISFEKTDGKVLDKPVLYVARMPHKGKMYRVYTSNGIVNITGDHSLFTFNGKGDIRPTKTKDLKKGDFVVIPHKVGRSICNTHVNLLDYISESELSVKGAGEVLDAIRRRGTPSKVLAAVGATRYIMKDAKGSDRVRAELAKNFVDIEASELCLKSDSQAILPAKLQLTRSLGYVAGMFCAEGHVSRAAVIISNANNELLNKVKTALDEIGYGWYRYYPGKEHGMATDQIVINGILGVFLQRSCTENKSKVVPSWVITAPNQTIDGFLEGFYDGEGSNRKSAPDEWSVTNTSTKLVAGISLLLLLSGRESHIYETRRSNPNWKTCYEIRESTERKVNPFTCYTTEKGYETYKKHINAKTREAVEWMIQSDLSVSIIRKIEEYEYDGPVYDISVPGTEAFLGGIGNVFFKNTLFLDFNIHTGVPTNLKHVPAIGPGGKYMWRWDAIPATDEWSPLEEKTIDGDWCLVLPNDGTVVLREHDGKQEFLDHGKGKVLTYGDFHKEAEDFCDALLDVWNDGDANGHIFEFPKCDFHVSDETFSDPRQLQIFQHACEVAAHNGSVYFVFDRDSVTVASCCFEGNTRVMFSYDGGKTTCDSGIAAAYDMLTAMPDNEKDVRVWYHDSWNPARIIKLPGKGKKMIRIASEHTSRPDLPAFCDLQIVTCDHLVPTNRGDVRADELRLTDRIEYGTMPWDPKDADSTYGEIVTLQVMPEEEWVYCFELEHGFPPYFTLPNGIVTHNCRLRVQLDPALYLHPERMRSCGFANVTINLPQASYRTGIPRGEGDPTFGSDTWNRYTEEVAKAMDLALKAHLQKKAHIERMMSGPDMPLWQVAKPCCDGTPYISLDKCVYIIGLIGLDDACRQLFGKSMYEDDKLTDWGLKVIAFMNLRAKEYTDKYGLKFTLEESPAESAARKLARSDLAHFPQAKDIVKGSEGNEFYTNSVHVPADAPVSLVDRIVRQGMFHGMIDSGAITHAFIGEETPSPGAIANIVEETFRRTQSAQITFSPEFTYCMDCGGQARGLVEECPHCGSKNVEGETRVVGYFSRISGWNKSKRFGELVARHKGRYAVQDAGGEK